MVVEGPPNVAPSPEAGSNRAEQGSVFRGQALIQRKDVGSVIIATDAGRGRGIGCSMDHAETAGLPRNS